MLLIFCPHGRCGSTSLYDCIAKSCNIRAFNEPFNFSFFNNSEREIIKNLDIDSAINHLKDNYDLIKNVSISLSPSLNFKLIDASNKVLVLYRKFAIDQILSVYMSTSFKANSNMGIWHKHSCLSTQDMNNFYTYQREIVSKEFIEYEFNKIDNDFYLYKTYILNNKKDHLFISYEDLFIDRNISFETILSFFNLSLQDLAHINLLDIENKFNTIEVYKKVIPNFDDIYKLRQEFTLHA